MELLLLSNSQIAGLPPFEHARPELEAFLAGTTTVHFIAHALHDRDAYAAAISEQLSTYGVRTIAVHRLEHPVAEIAEAKVVFVGGGNTFRLLAGLQQDGLLDPIRSRVQAGNLRYLGSSAGSNLAAPTIRTTNDMPIVAPRNFGAFGFLPFQINPHYLDADPQSTHMGETRALRIQQFLEENDVPVMGLREGAWLRRSGARLSLGGLTGAVLFRRGRPPAAYGEGGNLGFLLESEPRFDVPL
jgi:dipeptidase E